MRGRRKSYARLAPWNEAVGHLSEIKLEDDKVLAKLNYWLIFEFPPTLRKELQRLVGKKIRILRTDNSYRLGLLPDESNAIG